MSDDDHVPGKCPASPVTITRQHRFVPFTPEPGRYYPAVPVAVYCSWCGAWSELPKTSVNESVAR